jgi:hypothetical protein
MLNTREQSICQCLIPSKHPKNAISYENGSKNEWEALNFHALMRENHASAKSYSQFILQAGRVVPYTNLLGLK